MQIATATLSSTTTDTDISIQPNGNGEIVLDGIVRVKPIAVTCSSTQRGVLKFEEEVVPSTGDKLFVCVKTAAGLFQFKEVTN